MNCDKLGTPNDVLVVINKLNAINAGTEAEGQLAIHSEESVIPVLCVTREQDGTTFSTGLARTGGTRSPENLDLVPCPSAQRHVSRSARRSSPASHRDDRGIDEDPLTDDLLDADPSWCNEAIDRAIAQLFGDS